MCAEHHYPFAFRQDIPFPLQHISFQIKVLLSQIDDFPLVEEVVHAVEILGLLDRMQRGSGHVLWRQQISRERIIAAGVVVENVLHLKYWIFGLKVFLGTVANLKGEGGGCSSCFVKNT